MNINIWVQTIVISNENMEIMQKYFLSEWNWRLQCFSRRQFSELMLKLVGNLLWSMKKFNSYTWVEGSRANLYFGFHQLLLEFGLSKVK